jgi:hypothetical protein
VVSFTLTDKSREVHFKDGVLDMAESDRELWILPGDKSDKIKWKRTEAFNGLAPSPDGGFWAIAYRALYHFHVDGSQDKKYELPEFEAVSGIPLSRALPGVIVLQADVNWAVSTSGQTPIIVPLTN